MELKVLSVVVVMAPAACKVRVRRNEAGLMTTEFKIEYITTSYKLQMQWVTNWIMLSICVTARTAIFLTRV